MTITTYDVKGMTCGHCAGTVSGSVTKLEGVTDVAVDLDTGKVTITSQAPLDVDVVRAAVEEAGFEFAS